MSSSLSHNQEQMVYWITEREKIRLAKESGQSAPWSSNKVMQETYFCNVNREDDKVTRWVRNHSKPVNEAFNMMVARMVNKPESLEEMLWPFPEWDSYYQAKFLQTMSKAGSWGGAYIVSTNGNKMKKHDYILSILTEAFDELQLMSLDSTLASAHKELMSLNGLASFLAAQVVADLKNTPWHPLAQAPDWRTFSAFGPGSLRGLSWFFETEVTRKTYQARIDEAYDILEFELPDTILDILCHQNLQNCFCEYDKFMRVTNGTGRSKRKYRGTGE